MTLRNPKCIHMKTKSILRMGNSCYHHPEPLVFCLILKNTRLKYTVQQLCQLFPMSEKVDITLREEHKLMDIQKIFVLKREELTKDWRKLHNEKLQDFCSSLHITTVIKSRLMKWVIINICTSMHKH